MNLKDSLLFLFSCTTFGGTGYGNVGVHNYVQVYRLIMQPGLVHTKDLLICCRSYGICHPLVSCFTIPHNSSTSSELLLYCIKALAYSGR